MSKLIQKSNNTRNVFGGLRRRAGQALAAVAGMGAAGLALASTGGGGLGAAAMAEVAGIRADVSSILMVLVGVVFLLVAWSYFKRAK